MAYTLYPRNTPATTKNRKAPSPRSKRLMISISHKTTTSRNPEEISPMSVPFLNLLHSLSNRQKVVQRLNWIWLLVFFFTHFFPFLFFHRVIHIPDAPKVNSVSQDRGQRLAQFNVESPTFLRQRAASILGFFHQLFLF